MGPDNPIIVRVFGVPTANSCGPQDAWRDATEWTANSLKKHFGEQVRVQYYDLFSSAVDGFPAVVELVRRGEATPPLVFIGDCLFSSGGRISGPAIRRQLEALGLTPVPS